jgi:hypothetical protein
MKRWCAAALVILAGCKPPADSVTKAVIGAVLVEPSSAPVSRSVIVVAGSRIRAVGEQASTPVPAGSEKVDGSGLFLVPAFVDVKKDLPRVRTLEEAAKYIEEGASALSGMVVDTEEFPQEFVQRLRDLRVVFVPRLKEFLKDGEVFERASRNTAKLAALGILIGAASKEEFTLLADAGLTPQQVLAAATTHAARAEGVAADRGTIAAGARADVCLLRGNPLESATNLAKVDRCMINGEWGR